MKTEKLGTAQKAFFDFVAKRGFFPLGGFWAGNRATPDKLAQALIKKNLLVQKYDGYYPTNADQTEKNKGEKQK